MHNQHVDSTPRSRHDPSFVADDVANGFGRPETLRAPVEPREVGCHRAGTAGPAGTAQGNGRAHRDGALLRGQKDMSRTAEKTTSSSPAPASACRENGRREMTAFQILHRTIYRYRRPVALGIHRLKLRPRETRDLRVVSADIALTPPAPLTWAKDVFGNAVATVSFPASTDVLNIESRIVLEHHSEPWPLFDIARSAITFPFQ
jgi:hypothetical protein